MISGDVPYDRFKNMDIVREVKDKLLLCEKYCEDYIKGIGNTGLSKTYLSSQTGPFLMISLDNSIRTMWENVHLQLIIESKYDI